MAFQGTGHFRVNDPNAAVQAISKPNADNSDKVRPRLLSKNEYTDEPLTSTSISEAQSSAGQLKTLIQQVLDSNLEISQRIANLEMRTLGYSQDSAPTLAALDIDRDDDSINTIKAVNVTNKGSLPPEERVETFQKIDGNSGKESEDLQGSNFSFTFDQDLNNSRPYARVMKRNSVLSTASSVAHTMSWSCLSGLSLGEISGISVIGLPISTHELWNGHHYITTNKDMARPLDRIEPPTSDGLANEGNHSLSDNEEWPLKAHKGTSFHNGVQSLSDSATFDTGRQVKRVHVRVGERRTEPKRIMLLGTTPIKSR